MWSLEQKQKYLANIFGGKTTLTPTLIFCYGTKKDKIKYYSEVLDGKQRINACIEFVENEIPLENGLYFKDLCERDRVFFMFMNVKYMEYECWRGGKNLTLQQKIELFLEINELGTRMSEEHINSVKKLLGENYGK